MKLTIKKGVTNKILHVFIQDSSSDIGGGLTGLVYNTSGLTAYYIRPGATGEIAIILADIVTLGTYVSGGFKEVDSANMPGIYEFDLPDACLSTSADQVVIMLSGAVDMAPTLLEIQLDDNITKDVYDLVNSLNDFNASTTPVELLASGGTAGKNVEEIVDDIWDEILTGATHNITNSGGKMLRELMSLHSQEEGVAQAGSANTITLAATADANNDFYKHTIVSLSGGTGVGQYRLIGAYNGTTKVATLEAGHDWVIVPDNTSEYQVVNFGMVHAHIADTLGTQAVEDIDTELTTNHGAGSWAASGVVVLPVMQGEVYSAVATQDKEVTIVKGDTPRIIFDLGLNYTGWTIWFAAKEKMSDTSYIISLRQVTWSDASLGQGYIDLSASDTNIMGKFFAELELRQGAQRLTAMKYKLTVIDDVIDA
jgi:hypothetical protein